MCTEVIWRMPEGPYEKIREYELKTRELKEADFELKNVSYDRVEIIDA